ncbi:hypothetical protein [Streptomyces sp. NRRL S-813]|nr:hypothetical protein [Streptomyces sp. NRRL S-813]
MDECGSVAEWANRIKCGSEIRLDFDAMAKTLQEAEMEYLAYA